MDVALAAEAVYWGMVLVIIATCLIYFSLLDF